MRYEVQWVNPFTREERAEGFTNKRKAFAFGWQKVLANMAWVCVKDLRTGKLLRDWSA